MFFLPENGASMSKDGVVDHEQIVRQASDLSKLPIKTVSIALDAIIAAMSDSISKGHTIHLSGLGTFSVPQKQKRTK